jgi:hypothetical protein
MPLLKRVLGFHVACFRVGGLIMGVGASLMFIAFLWRILVDGYVTIDGRRSTDPRDIAWVLGFLLTPALLGILIFQLLSRVRDR